MDAQEIRATVHTLVEQMNSKCDPDGYAPSAPRDADALTDAISTRVLAEAFPNEVKRINDLKKTRDGFLCSFQKLTEIKTKFPNLGCFISEEAFAALGRL